MFTYTNIIIGGFLHWNHFTFIQKKDYMVISCHYPNGNTKEDFLGRVNYLQIYKKIQDEVVFSSKKGGKSNPI